MTRRPGALVLAAGIVAASLGACSSPPDVPSDSWQVSPIEFDTASDGDRERLADTTYPMAHLAGDTAGGFWAESSGSWLHLDGNGDTLRRFNDESISTVHGIAAVSPTVLAVSLTDRSRASELGMGLFRFDTDAGTRTRIDVEATRIGDVASDREGRVVFVDYVGDYSPGSLEPSPPDLNDPPLPAELTPFAIRAVDRSGVQTTILGVEAGLTAAIVAIDTDADGTVYVSTEAATFVVTADGAVSQIGTHPTRVPVLAVSPTGEVLAPAPGAPTTTVAAGSWGVVSGSPAAREVMSEHGDCSHAASPGLSLIAATQTTILPFSCQASGAVWLTGTSFVLSIGVEGGAVLARVTPPANRGD